MKLSQEQTEGKLPEPGGCTLRGERAGEGTGHFWAIASCPRLGPPHTTGGAASSGLGRWELGSSSPCDQLICAELT